MNVFAASSPTAFDFVAALARPEDGISIRLKGQEGEVSLDQLLRIQETIKKYFPGYMLETPNKAQSYSSIFDTFESLTGQKIHVTDNPRWQSIDVALALFSRLGDDFPATLKLKGTRNSIWVSSARDQVKLRKIDFEKPVSLYSSLSSPPLEESSITKINFRGEFSQLRTANIGPPGIEPWYYTRECRNCEYQFVDRSRALIEPLFTIRIDRQHAFAFKTGKKRLPVGLLTDAFPAKWLDEHYGEPFSGTLKTIAGLAIRPSQGDRKMQNAAKAILRSFSCANRTDWGWVSGFLAHEQSIRKTSDITYLVWLCVLQNSIIHFKNPFVTMDRRKVPSPLLDAARTAAFDTKTEDIAGMITEAEHTKSFAARKIQLFWEDLASALRLNPITYCMLAAHSQNSLDIAPLEPEEVKMCAICGRCRRIDCEER